jgi:hypothetical protein
MPFLFASGLCLSALLSLSLCCRGHQDGLRCAAPCWQADRLLSRQALGRRCFSIRRPSMPPLASVANQHVRSSSIQSKHVLPRLHSNPIIGRELLNATRHLSLHEKKKKNPKPLMKQGLDSRNLIRFSRHCRHSANKRSLLLFDTSTVP